MTMPVFANVDRRTTLTVPTDRSQVLTQSVAILAVSLLSLLGAGWMILSFFCFKSLRSFRHQLILGLALSDFLMAANFVLSTSSNIAGRDIGAPEQAALCSFNGFMTQVFVIQTDYWVFLISLCTYFILAGFKTPSSWVQDNRLILAALPWVLSVTWAGIGLGTAGYGNIGAWCWFTSDEVRLLVNFIPRWVIIVAILFMYGNLYYMLHRAHRRMLSLRYFSSDGVSRQRNTEGLQQPQERPGPSANRQPLSNPAESEDKINKMKNLARRMLLYPLAYMLIWSLPTAVRIYQSTRGVPAPFALQTVDKVNGLANATDQDVTAVPQLITRDVNADVPDRDQQEGFYSMSLHMDKDGRRSNSNTYIRDTLNDPAGYPLTVQTQSFVTRVLFDTRGRTPVANAVEVLRGSAVYRADPRSTDDNKGKREIIRAKREIIISGGTFNSPMILKHSGIGPAKELKKFGIKVVKDLPGVGENMAENYEAGLLGLANDDIELGFGQVGLLLKTPTETEDRNIHAWCGGFALEGFWPGMPNRYGPRQFMCAMAHMQPKSRAGSVRLRSSDPRDTPEINFRFWEVDGEDDLRELVDAIDIMRHGFQAAGAPVTPWRELHPCHDSSNGCSDEEQLDYFRYQSFGHHASSSCAIGAANDPMAVVDSKFRVHGVRNLRVVDASVFPHVPGAFPVLPTFIISDKASKDIIKAARYRRD